MAPFSWHKTEPHNWSTIDKNSMTMEMPPPPLKTYSRQSQLIRECIKCILMENTKQLFSSDKGFPTTAMYHHREII